MRLLLAAVLCGLAGPALGQTPSVSDTAAVPVVVVSATDGRSPRGAVRRALLVPGWGQIYNGQVYKVPFVYAGLAGFVGGAVYYTQEHRFWDRAFLYIRSEELIQTGEQEANAFAAFEAEYLELIAQENNGQPVASSRIRPVRDNLRRNRDLFYFGCGLWYALTVLDAYVSAHLLDFDVGDDLSVRLVPTPNGVSATAIVALPWGR